MRSPLQKLVDRPLALRREVSAVGTAVVGILLAFGIGWLAGLVPPEGSLERRASWVLALACVGPVAAWIAQNESSVRVRALPALVLLAPLGHLLVPGSALAATTTVVVLVTACVVVLARAVWRVSSRRHGSSAHRRLGTALVLVLALPGPLFTLSWGLGSSIAIPGVVRAMHRSPTPAPATETAVEIATPDGLLLRGGYSVGEAGAPGVVLVHGYNDSRARMAGWAELLAARGAHVLRLDQRAAGVSDGTVCTFADREAGDVALAVRWLAARPGVDRARVSALGASMGGGAVLAALPLLGADDLHAIALLAPASDYPPIVLRRSPPEPVATLMRAMIWGVPHAMGHASPLELVPARGLDGRTVPGVVVHSRSDRTILPELTERLVAAHPSLEVHWLDGVSHDQTPRAAREDDVSRGAILRVLGL